MALIMSASPRVFNDNTGKQVYDAVTTSSKGSKCHCCPFGYHIDLDFVEYCEAVAAGGQADKATLERRKKREKRKQCQSMEILLGLVSPAINDFETELLELAQHQIDSSYKHGQLADIQPIDHFEKSIAPDLNEAIGDFEATLKRLSKKETHPTKIDGSQTILSPTQQPIYMPPGSVDFDNPSIGSPNSNRSTGTLQNIREQMAVSLERMRELEEQVKAIPVLQIQVSVLKEEKRDLQKQIVHLNEYKKCREPSSLSLKHEKLSSSNPTECKDTATMCSVLTRDVGVSHQPTRTRDVGMVTSTPKAPNYSPLVPMSENDSFSSSFNDTYSSSLLSTLSLSTETDENTSPEVCRKQTHNMNKLQQGPLNIENILPETILSKDSSTNTCRIDKKRLTTSDVFFEEIPPSNVETVGKKSISSQTSLKIKDTYTAEDVTSIVENAMKAYKKAMQKTTVFKEIQCNLLVENIVKQPPVVRQHREIQVSEPFKMKTNVGITAKPKTAEIGTDVGIGPGTRSIASGPDPIAIQQTISLNSMSNQLRSHSFNYGDTDIMRPKRKTTRSIGSIVEGLIKTTAKSTQTTNLMPKTREFGTSPLKKKFIDVSVGDSLKPHISISCAANYCDNCKETIKSLAKQISPNDNDHHHIKTVDHTNAIITSRIPRPFHIPLNTHDYKRQFKRQDTYTKIPTGIIRYDTDNKETYHTDNKSERMEVEGDVKKCDNLVNDLVYGKDTIGSEICKDEKSLPESALFEPIRDKFRTKKEPSKEMRAAMKVLNDNLRKSPGKNQVSHQTKNAVNVIQQEWFKISSTAQADPLDVEDYLDCFEEYSSCLLEYIVNMTDSSGNTAMHYAVSHGNFDVVSILLDSKVCDINKPNVAGYTAVMLAALAEVRNSTHASVAKRLFQLADVNIRAKLHGQTALMLAVSHGRKDMTNLLLEAGAAVNIQDEDGSTALMCAAEHGHTEIVRLLLAHPECDSSITDVDASSALKIALEAGHRDIGILLYAHEHVNRGTSPYSSMRRSRRGSKPTTPTGPSPSAPASPAPSRKFHSSNASLNISRYSAK